MTNISSILRVLGNHKWYISTGNEGFFHHIYFIKCDDCHTQVNVEYTGGQAVPSFPDSEIKRVIEVIKGLVDMDCEGQRKINEIDKVMEE